MSTIKVRAAQFAVDETWEANVRRVHELIDQAHADNVDLLVLPEGILARFNQDKKRIRTAAQSLDGPFVSRVLEHTRGRRTSVVFSVHEKHESGKPYNTALAMADGEIRAIYRKIHLYDAFSNRESDDVTPGSELPPVIDVHGFLVGIMTCYDLRFPELARYMALQGAKVIALPAAWASGINKEHHWRTLVTARALDNTVYLVAADEAGPTTIGKSLIVDPLGVTMASANEGAGAITATLNTSVLETARDKLPVLANHRIRLSPGVHPSSTTSSDRV